jgi:hypothetical protein
VVYSSKSKSVSTNDDSLLARIEKLEDKLKRMGEILHEEN